MKVCVSCQADVGGKNATPVKEDRIIKTIRAVKKLFGVAQMNKLFVCEACMPKYLERRRSFEKTMLFASVLAGIMLLLIIIAPIMSGRFDVWTPVSGVIVALFILVLPMFKYTPAVEGISASGPALGAIKSPPEPVPMPPPVPTPFFAPAKKKEPAKEKKKKK